MGIRRGTVLGLTGIAGALIEQQFGLLGGVLASLFGIGLVPPAFAWVLGVSVGVIAGDLATALTGQDVATGRWAGIKKGVLASLVAGLGYYLSATGLAVDLLGPYLAGVPLGASDAVKLGSIWLGAVLGDLFGA